MVVRPLGEHSEQRKMRDVPPWFDCPDRNVVRKQHRENRPGHPTDSAPGVSRARFDECVTDVVYHHRTERQPAEHLLLPTAEPNQLPGPVPGLQGACASGRLPRGPSPATCSWSDQVTAA